MADIRQNATVKDDFAYAPQDPLSNGGKWIRTDLASPSLVANTVLLQTCARHRASESSFSSWNAEGTLDNDAAECWAQVVGGGASGNVHGVGIFASTGGTNAADGYLFELARSSAGDFYRFWRATNWVFTSIGSTAPPSGNAVPGSYILIRRTGNNVEGWHNPSGDLTTWLSIFSVNDTTWTTGFYPTLHTDQSFTSINIGLDAFGGGPAAVTTKHLLPILGVGA